jgi:hypothetical protein
LQQKRRKHYIFVEQAIIWQNDSLFFYPKNNAELGAKTLTSQNSSGMFKNHVQFLHNLDISFGYPNNRKQERSKKPYMNTSQKRGTPYV